MKTTTKTMTFFSILTIVTTGLLMTTTTIPAAYAEVTVSLPAGSSVPGCEETDACYIPSSVNVGVDHTVTWSNDDTAAHTVTSGSAANGFDGVFDSSLFAAGTIFSHTFEEEGTFDYFCMVHPWMVGSVVVGATVMTEGDDNDKMHDDMEDKDNDEMHEMEGEGEMILKSMSSDGTIEVNVEAYDPIAGQGMELEVEFMDVASGNQVEHINYDLAATQNDKIVLYEIGVHQDSGEGEHMTDALDTDDPVDVSITIQGIGVDQPFTGPQGDTVEFTVVPEFGTIAMMILAVAIILIVAVSAKSRLSIMPRL